MFLQRLEVRDFRNIEDTTLTFGAGFNVLWGDNGQGKTNLLEALYLIGNLKSFRGARNPELIRSGVEAARLRAEIASRGVARRLELAIDRQQKAGRVDGKEVRSAEALLGILRAVLFAPEEVGIVKGGPAGRRRLIDRAVFQADPTYLGRAQEYGRLLRQRNCLLKQGAGSGEIAPWTENLVRAGARIRRDRAGYVERLIPLLREAYRNIAGEHEEADLRYHVGEGEATELEEALRRDLERHNSRERLLGQTLAGPHRDDPQFVMNGRPLRQFGSQGQQRSFVLAFKASQIMDLEARTGESPVLLLDDLTSELDRRRQGYFFRFLLERQGQVFITTTDMQPLIDEGLRDARFFKVERGTFADDRRE